MQVLEHGPNMARLINSPNILTHITEGKFLHISHLFISEYNSSIWTHHIFAVETVWHKEEEGYQASSSRVATGRI
jgi:hypothetical protein